MKKICFILLIVLMIIFACIQCTRSVLEIKDGWVTFLIDLEEPSDLPSLEEIRLEESMLQGGKLVRFFSYMTKRKPVFPLYFMDFQKHGYDVVLVEKEGELTVLIRGTYYSFVSGFQPGHGSPAIEWHESGKLNEMPTIQKMVKRLGDK